MISLHHTNPNPNVAFHHANSPSTFPTPSKTAGGWKKYLCRTPPCMAKNLLQPLLPTTCPSWSGCGFWIIEIMEALFWKSEPWCWPIYSVESLWQVRPDNPNWHVCTGKFVEKYVCSHQMFFHTSAASKAMLFLWLMGFRFPVAFPPVPKSCGQKNYETVVWFQSKR